MNPRFYSATTDRVLLRAFSTMLFSRLLLLSS